MGFHPCARKVDHAWHVNSLPNYNIQSVWESGLRKTFALFSQHLQNYFGNQNDQVSSSLLFFIPKYSCLFAQRNEVVATTERPHVNCILHCQHPDRKNNFNISGQNKEKNQSFIKNAICYKFLSYRYPPQHLSLLANILEAEPDFQKSLRG